MKIIYKIHKYCCKWQLHCYKIGPSFPTCVPLVLAALGLIQCSDTFEVPDWVEAVFDRMLFGFCFAAER